ncbi:MAG: type II toxin-antitoxin system RelE/ParE family toxin [Chloroflexi bacterium]|nr:type II toxin-antitoxin system RelE/ParE family toxin [Chloroflexota bacterium]
MHRLEVSPAADRDLEKRRIQRQDFESLRLAARSLASEPRPQGVMKTRGAENAYRIRVGSYRVVYEVYDNENLVLILQVVPRTEVRWTPKFGQVAKRESRSWNVRNVKE